MPPDFIQLLVGGILLGGIYGLAAFGLSITFGVLNVLNLAHGEFLMLGALMGYVLFSALGLNPFISAMAVIPIFMIAGIGFYFLLLKPISEKPPHQLLVASILVTLGASLIIEDLTAYFWERPVTGIAYSLPPLERGIAQCLEGAKVVGIPIVLVSALTFGLGVALAASAGVFYVTLFTVTPIMGIPLSVKYMCIVVLGGLGSLVGSVVGGLILGVAESFTAYYFGAEWSPTIAFILLIVILIVKPEGLFGKKG